jgi:cell division protein FtsL
MMRLLLTIVMIVTAAFGLYQVKYRVHTIRTQIAEVQQQIEAERENLHVVAAEWTYLTRPDRLKRLATNHTNLQPLSSKQVVAGIDAIPFAEVAEQAPTMNENIAPVSQIVPEAE